MTNLRQQWIDGLKKDYPSLPMFMAEMLVDLHMKDNGETLKKVKRDYEKEEKKRAKQPKAAVEEEPAGPREYVGVTVKDASEIPPEPEAVPEAVPEEPPSDPEDEVQVVEATNDFV